MPSLAAAAILPTDVDIEQASSARTFRICVEHGQELVEEVHRVPGGPDGGRAGRVDVLRCAATNEHDDHVVTAWGVMVVDDRGQRRIVAFATDLLVVLDPTALDVDELMKLVRGKEQATRLAESTGGITVH